MNILCGVGDEYAARGRRLLLDTTDQNAVLQRTQPHCWPPRTYKIWGSGTVGLRVPDKRPLHGARSAEYKDNGLHYKKLSCYHNGVSQSFSCKSLLSAV